MRLPRICRTIFKSYSTSAEKPIVEGIRPEEPIFTVYDKTYKKDDYTNITPRISSFIGRNLHNREHHPLCLVKQKITNFFYENFIGRTGNPTFSVYDEIKPVVSVAENFDSLLVPPDHVSRSKSDSYYLNKEFLLRSHTTAHQAELISMGLDNFLVFGDCYRRDEIDAKHYPVFHQVDGVYSLNRDQVGEFIERRLSHFVNLFDRSVVRFPQIERVLKKELEMFENADEDTEEKQKFHTLEASKFVEHHLKEILTKLIEDLFGKGMIGYFRSEAFWNIHFNSVINLL